MTPKNKSLKWILALAAIFAVLMVAGCAQATPAPVEPTETTAPTAIPATEIPTEVPPTATPEPTAVPTVGPDENFPLTILHTNDVHSHYEPGSDGNGGAAIAASVIEQVRAASPYTLLLNAGDNFTGTLFYVTHHGLDSAELMNDLGYDAMTLGNHEFDEGDENLGAFIDQVTFPVVAANVNVEGDPALAGKVAPYTILERGGQQIGVIGLTNPDMATLSSPGDALIFDADLAAVTQAAVDELTAEGVNKIIVLSHNGYTADMALAAAVTGVDVIVGGHSHTLLADYDSRAAGAYPSEVQTPDGKTTLVVQAGEYLQFIGKLDVEFDPAGELVSWDGDTILLSGYITPNAMIAGVVAELKEPVAALTAEVIGQTTVRLEGDRTVCRFQECNLGNLITDAMREETGVQIAIENGGGIRASVEAGDITTGDVLSILPFGNLVSTFKLSGTDLLAALENGVSKVDSEEGTGRFPQVSGIRFQFDVSQPAGSRIVSVEVLDENGEYQPLDLNATYTVASNDFMRGGGDGYTMFAENATDAYDFGRPLDEVLADYIKAHSPISIEVEGRITTQPQ